ncbi:MAG: glycosyltransferase family 4 protein [candidate division WOR-3 bacterium]|nr:MAG: glycosyltransferase family 4 protein [candidate division WOR-3 bacterium]
MRVWLVKIGESLPLFHPHDRQHRTGILVRYLTAAEHSVVWWSSTFDHARKRYEVAGDQCIEGTPLLTYRLLRGLSYGRNVSLRRIVDHWLIGRKFRRYADAEPKPDIVVCSLPTIELCYEATKYGKRNAVPVLLDIRDLWPQVMLDLVPSVAVPLGKAALAPYFRMARRACSQATGLLGITRDFVDWGLELAGREVGPTDRWFPLSNDAEPPSAVDQELAMGHWRSLGLRESDFIACFMGIMGTRRLLDLDTIIAAARILQHQVPNCKFVLCGTGDIFEYYRQAAMLCGNVIMPGWVDHAAMWTLVSMASVGLAPYTNTFSFARSYPNKVSEYLAAGLPIVSGLGGALSCLLADWQCGVTYAEGDHVGLAEAIRSLVIDRERLGRMRKQAGLLYQTTFDPAKVYAGMVSHIEDVAAGRLDRRASPDSRLPSRDRD